jgi:hypothetical protein
MNRKQLFSNKAVASRDVEETTTKLMRRERREVVDWQTVAQWQADKVQKELEREQHQSEARLLADEEDHPPWEWSVLNSTPWHFRAKALVMVSETIKKSWYSLRPIRPKRRWSNSAADLVLLLWPYSDGKK